MASNPSPEQISRIQEAARRSGCGGTLWLDLDPEGGFLRLRLTDLQNLSAPQLVGIFAQILSMAARMVNLEVREHVRPKSEQ